MTKTARNFVIAALVGGLTCVSVPALAASFHERGDFGGTWAHIGPSDQHVYRYRYVERVAPYPAPVYGPAYVYDPYDEPYYEPYDYGPGIAIGGPGFGVGIDLD